MEGKDAQDTLEIIYQEKTYICNTKMLTSFLFFFQSEGSNGRQIILFLVLVFFFCKTEIHGGIAIYVEHILETRITF